MAIKALFLDFIVYGSNQSYLFLTLKWSGCNNRDLIDMNYNMIADESAAIQKCHLLHKWDFFLSSIFERMNK